MNVNVNFIQLFTISARISAGAIGLPWAFREHDNFSTDIYILDHGKFFDTWRQFFPQCLLSFLCKLVNDVIKLYI